MVTLNGSLPRISVVIPNFNGAKYLRDCVDSIVGQKYDNLELIVMDAGSNDHSAEIVLGYGPAIDVFVSEPDSGQSEAINKGLARATGEIVAFVNSDDLLEQGSLERVGLYFKSYPSAEWLVGGCRVFGQGITDWYLHPSGWENLIETIVPWSRHQRYVFPQSGASFMRWEVVKRLGPYDTNLHYSMDMEYYARAAFCGVKMEIVTEVLAGWRWHLESKSWTRGIEYAFRKDELEILRRYLHQLPELERNLGTRALKEESQAVVIREANYWARNGERLQGLQMLLGLGLKSPSWIFRRIWLGGVRRAFCGWETAS